MLRPVVYTAITPVIKSRYQERSVLPAGYCVVIDSEGKIVQDYRGVTIIAKV